MLRSVFLISIVCVFALACGNSSGEKPSVDSNYISIQTSDTISSVRTDSVLNGKEIGFYLALPAIPENIKSLYRSRNDRKSAEQINIPLDSIYSTDSVTQPFYIFVTTLLMKHTDGAYSEHVGIVAKKYVETHSVQFVQLFSHEPLLNDSCLSNWVRAVSGEIKIVAEGGEEAELMVLEKTMMLNCKNSSESELNILHEFVDGVYAELKH